MVPQNSPPPFDPERQLSPATIQGLRDVIAARWRTLEQSEAQLRHAVHVAAAEGRERGLRPEELVVILKGIEADVFAAPGAMRATDRDARRRFREWLVTSCLEAYFADDRS